MRALPTGPLPLRLSALAGYLEKTEDVFAEWQLRRVKPVAELFPDNEADLIDAAARDLVPFAGDVCGGGLVLDVSGGDPERAPVVAFSSEGGIDVLGDSFDDFLALLAASEPDQREDAWSAEGPLKKWIRRAGVAPHRSATARLRGLSETTRLFWSAWAGALRAASAKLRPNEVVDHELVLGERIGDVALGMPRETLDARWGPPVFPTWGVSTHGVTALYAESPVGVRLDGTKQRVTGITLFKGRHRAITSAGVSPLLMPRADALRWLASLGIDATCRGMEISVDAPGMVFSLTRGPGAHDAEPWIESIELTEPE